MHTCPPLKLLSTDSKRAWDSKTPFEVSVQVPVHVGRSRTHLCHHPGFLGWGMWGQNLQAPSGRRQTQRQSCFCNPWPLLRSLPASHNCEKQSQDSNPGAPSSGNGTQLGQEERGLGAQAAVEARRPQQRGQASSLRLQWSKDKSSLVWAILKVYFQFAFYCGKIHIKFTFLTTFECTVQWH